MSVWGVRIGHPWFLVRLRDVLRMMGLAVLRHVVWPRAACPILADRAGDHDALHTAREARKLEVYRAADVDRLNGNWECRCVVVRTWAQAAATMRIALAAAMCEKGEPG
jgi:hypothetical protein